MNFDPVHWSLCLGCWSANLGSLHSCFGSGESCHLLFQTGTFASNAGSLHWPYCICFADRCWLVCSKLMPKCCDKQCFLQISRIDWLLVSGSNLTRQLRIDPPVFRPTEGAALFRPRDALEWQWCREVSHLYRWLHHLWECWSGS